MVKWLKKAREKRQSTWLSTVSGAGDADASLEHYERRLFAAWCAFDAGGGPLSRAAALSLCDALQLERRGTQLVEQLFQRSDRVSFGQFRSGLLAVLGATPAPATVASDEDSGREVAPRLVLGAKRYGRRSRPPRPPAPPPPLQHDAPVDAAHALALCRGLHMDGVDQDLVERIFEATPSSSTTVGEFFDRLNAELGSMAGAVGPDALPAEELLDAWERGGVQHPRHLLTELGFDTVIVSALALEAALERELGALSEPEARALLLQAALALSRLRLARTQHSAGELTAERDRLRADVADSERRARLLAQETDDSHARLEAELSTALRRADARLADAQRQAEAELTAERERFQTERNSLQTELQRRIDAEARLRSEVDAAESRAAASETRVTAAEQRAAAADRERARLVQTLQELQDSPPPVTPPAVDEALQQLRADNLALRDRCDELTALLEARPPPQPAPIDAVVTSLKDEAASLDTTDRLEQCDSLLSVAATSDKDGLRAERDRLNETIRELEVALEAMRVEYERCEDYWDAKLREERELYATEQRVQDEKLADLLTRINDYERKFNRTLPAIPEQGEELERELLAVKAQHAREIQQRDKRLKRARERLRLAAAAAASATSSNAALQQRLTHAEQLTARLTARLANADMLVKELYVDNCMLAPNAPIL